MPDGELELKTFNFLNPDSGRSVFRQSALDTLFLAGMVADGMIDVPASLVPASVQVQMHEHRMTFMGHSQGGISGVLVGAVEPSLKAYVLSGGGGGLSLTIMLRKDQGDISGIVTGILSLDEFELSEFHPAISLVQMLVDTTDPLAYGGRFFRRDAGTRPPHVLMTEGLHDEQTPSATAETLAASMRLGVVEPAAHYSDGMALLELPVWKTPVHNNRSDGDQTWTAVLAQYPNNDHFAVFQNESAARRYADFLEGVVSTGEGIVH